MKYEALIKRIRNINTVDAEISLGFGVKVNAVLILKDISSLKTNHKMEEAVKYLRDKLVGKEEVEIDIKLAKEHSLAIVYLDGKNVNEELINKGLANKFIKKE